MTKKIIIVFFMLLSMISNAQNRTDKTRRDDSFLMNKTVPHNLVSSQNPGLWMWGYSITPCLREGLGVTGSIKGSLGTFYDTINLEAGLHAFFYLGFEDDNSAANIFSFPISVSPRINMLPQTRYQTKSLSFQPDFVFVPGKSGIHIGGTIMYTSYKMSFGFVAWPDIFYGISVSIYNF